MPQQLTDAELAKAWRAKYPGAYDDMSDPEIAAAVRAKRPDFLTELQPPVTSVPFKEGERPNSAPDAGALFRSVVPTQTANIADAIQGSSENPEIAKARGFAAGSAKSVMDTTTSPVGILASLLGPEIGQLVGNAKNIGPAVEDILPYAGRKLGSALETASEYDVTKPLSWLKYLADRLSGYGQAGRDANLMLGRAGSATTPAAPGGALPPARDLYPLFKAGEGPQVNPAAAPRLVKQPPDLSQVLTTALDEARAPGAPSRVSGPPEPTITPAGREGDFQSSGRPSVSQRAYDEIAAKKQNGRGSAAAASDEQLAAENGKRAATAERTGGQPPLPQSWQRFSSEGPYKGEPPSPAAAPKAEATSGEPATFYKVAGNNTDRAVEKAIADGDYDEAGRIMARGLDNFFGGSVEKWKTRGMPGIAAALTEGLRRQLKSLTESDTYQSADPDKQENLIHRALSDPQRRRQLLQLAGAK